MNTIRLGVASLIVMQWANVINDTKIAKENKNEVINAGMKNTAKTTQQIAKLDSTIKANAVSYEKALEAINAQSKANAIVANKEIKDLSKTLKALSKQLASTAVSDTAKAIKTIR